MRNGPLPIFLRTLLKRPLQPTTFISANIRIQYTYKQYFEFFLVVECQSLQLARHPSFGETAQHERETGGKGEEED